MSKSEKMSKNWNWLISFTTTEDWCLRNIWRMKKGEKTSVCESNWCSISYLKKRSRGFLTVRWQRALYLEKRYRCLAVKSFWESTCFTMLSNFFACLSIQVISSLYCPLGGGFFERNRINSSMICGSKKLDIKP